MIFQFLTHSKNTFEGIRENETVLFLLRRHWIVPLLAVISFILAAFLPLAVIIVLGILYGFFGLGILIFLIYSLYLMFIWLGLFYSLTLYSLDVWIITNERIIDNRQFGFFNRVVSEALLTKIQDISIEIEGMIPTFLNYGNLKVQSAGTEERFLFLQISEPAKVKDEIMKLTKKQPAQHI